MFCSDEVSKKLNFLHEIVKHNLRKRQKSITTKETGAKKLEDTFKAEGQTNLCWSHEASIRGNRQKACFPDLTIKRIDSKLESTYTENQLKQIRSFEMILAKITVWKCWFLHRLHLNKKN